MNTVKVNLTGNPHQVALFAIALNDLLRRHNVVDVKVDVPAIPSWEPANRNESDINHTKRALFEAADRGLTVEITALPAPGE